MLFRNRSFRKIYKAFNETPTKGPVMRFVDLLPEKFVESDAVTRLRLKYENGGPMTKVAITMIPVTIGATLGLIATAGIYAGAKKFDLIENDEN